MKSFKIFLVTLVVVVILLLVAILVFWAGIKIVNTGKMAQAKSVKILTVNQRTIFSRLLMEWHFTILQKILQQKAIAREPAPPFGRSFTQII